MTRSRTVEEAATADTQREAEDMTTQSSSRYEERIRVLTTQQMRKLESDWIAQCDPNWGQVLMEIAGRGAAQQAHAMWLEQPGTVAIFCGRGNNGGDGMVVARYLHLWGVPVRIFIVSSAGTGKSRGGGGGGSTASGDVAMTTVEASTNRDILKKLGLKVETLTAGLLHSIFNDDGSGAGGRSDASQFSLIVDALFGTGMDREVEGLFADVIDRINDSGVRVLAVDLPSGINSDSGQIMGTAIRAARTVTFGCVKVGLLCYPGAEHAGRLSLVDIGLPAARFDKPVIRVTTVDHVLSKLPKRPHNSHKGTFGYLLTIAGSLGMSGATLLASQSGLKTGAGLAILATPKSLVPHLPPQEVIYHAIAETDDCSISARALVDLEDDLEKATGIVLGPGLSRNEETVSFVHKFLTKVLAKSDTPCIIDADGLNAVSENPKLFPKPSRHVVMTPHPKELSRLLGSSTSEIQSNRIAAAQLGATMFGCTVLLKGAYTVIAEPDGHVFINPTGNPAMAKAGAGDVLSGVIGGLMAQGVEAFDAAVIGAYVHGRAGDLAAEEIGSYGVLAGDIADFIPEALSTIESGVESDLEVALLAETGSTSL